MQYKGIELEDISNTPQLVEPPRKMLVWDDDPNGNENLYMTPKEAKVVAIVDSKRLNGRVVVDDDCIGFARYGHCAEVPKVRATYRQVSKWVAQGNGETTKGDITGNGVYCKPSFYYDSLKSNEKCDDTVHVRKWEDEDWHEPTLEYLGL